MPIKILLEIGLERVGKFVKTKNLINYKKFGFRLRVKDLLHAVGKKCGVDPHMIDTMNLENIVERVVAIHVRKILKDDILEQINFLFFVF